MVSRPEYSFKDRNLEVAVWSTKKQKADGGEVVFRNASVNRNYRDEEGVWKKTNYYDVDDLLRLAKLLEKVHEELSIKKKVLGRKNDGEELMIDGDLY